MAETNYPDVMTIGEPADGLRVHPQAVRRRVKSGTLPRARIGQTWRVRRVDLDRFLAGELREARHD